jgi:hypothetical protein
VVTPWSSIALFLAASLLGALGQLLYKSGTDAAAGTLASYVLNPAIAGGVVCYTAVMVLFVAAFRIGGNLATLYPVYATTFIWAALISRIAHGTPIRPIHIAGMGFLIVGMYCMGKQAGS